MTQLFADDGTVTPVTIVEWGPCTVMQLRTQETDGYDAVTLGYEDYRAKVSSKPQVEQAKKVGTAP